MDLQGIKIHGVFRGSYTRGISSYVRVVSLSKLEGDANIYVLEGKRLARIHEIEGKISMRSLPLGYFLDLFNYLCWGVGGYVYR